MNHFSARFFVLLSCLLVGVVSHASPASPKDVVFIMADGLNSADTKPVGDWTAAPNGHATLSLEDGQLVVTSTNRDPWLSTDDVPDAHGELVLVLTMSSDSQGSGQVFWTEGKIKAFRADRSVTFEPRHDGVAHEIQITWTTQENLTSLRIDPSRAEGVIKFDEIRLEDGAGQLLKVWDFADGPAAEPE